IEAIFSAADSGFKGSLLQLTSPTAYMGTITGCFLLPVKKQRSFLLLSDHTSSLYLSDKVSSVFLGLLPASSKRFKGAISSSISQTGTEGKQATNIRSRRLSSTVCIRTDKIKLLKIMEMNVIKIRGHRNMDSKVLDINSNHEFRNGKTFNVKKAKKFNFNT
uniref:Uncharacterized protein n=1 Tax=Salvator merianae TaxID=96440 RepID=A0A8D0BDU3_SALMN